MTIISLIDSLCTKYQLAHSSQSFLSSLPSFWQRNEEIEPEQTLIDRFNLWWNNVIINKTDYLNTKQLISLLQLMDEVMVRIRQKVRNNIATKKPTQFTSLEMFACELFTSLFTSPLNKNGDPVLEANSNILSGYEDSQKKDIQRQFLTLFSVSYHLRLLHRVSDYSTLPYSTDSNASFIVPKDIKKFYDALKNLIHPNWLYTLSQDNSIEDYLNYSRLQQILLNHRTASAFYRLSTNYNIAALVQAEKINLIDFISDDRQSLADHDNLRPDLTPYSENRKTFSEFLSDFISIEHVKNDLLFNHEAHEIIAEKQAENYRSLQV